MTSKATTVDAYLKSLPDDRRAAIEAVRKVVLDNLDSDYEEGMLYGMIGYFVPHSVFPQGYHCDPTKPLCFAGLASQKNHMALYLMCVYGDEKHRKWFESAWKKTGKKLDMGKACLRFKKAEDLALDVIGEAIARVPARKYIERYQSILNRPRESGKKAPKSTKSAKKKPTKR
jgi:hypothetical protein